jgi:hypothetical protein
MGLTVLAPHPQSPCKTLLDLMFACNARRTATVGLGFLDLAMFLTPSVLATLAMLFTRAGHGTQQKIFDYQQSSFVSRALLARISQRQCNGEKSVTMSPSIGHQLACHVPHT